MPIAIIIFLLVGYELLLPTKLFRDPLCTVITDRKGILLGAKVASDGQWRFPPSDSVPFKIKQATIAFEDRYFYFHPGINPVSIGRAFISNIRSRRVVSGGSTLTMQVIRLYRKGKSRNLVEKLIEAILATRLEIKYSKSKILALYTSNAPYGGNVVGVDAAAWRYFGVNSERLSWAEASTLAVLPNAPSLIHPGRNRAVLLKKRNRLLKKLYHLGWFDKTTLITAIAEGIPEKPNPMPVLALHLLNRIFLSTPEKNIETTLDAALQNNVTLLVEKHHNRQKYNEIQNAAAIVIEVETGNILAYVGNCGFPCERNHSNDVDVITAPRSTGSLLKPLLYAAMLDDGKILPTSLVADIPINLSGFSPENFDGQFEGAVPANRALSRSLNVPAVQMLKSFGVERFHHLIRSLGMKTIKQPANYYGLSLILGGAEGTLEEMTNIYASLSRVLNHYGETGLYYADDYHPVNYVLKNKPHMDKGVEQASILNASSIWCTYEAMVQVNRPEEEAGWQYFGNSRKIAWKTGTSFGYRDGWAIGTSGKYVVGVWFGNADGEGRPGLTGVSAAAPLLFEIFGLLLDSKWFDYPTDEFVDAVLCKSSGYIAGQYCTDCDTVKIPVTGTRSPTCPFHRLVHLTPDMKFQVNSDCFSTDAMIHKNWFVLPPVQEWYYKKRHADYQRLPPFMPGCVPVNVSSMELVYPREEVKIYIPRGLNGEKGRVVFEAVHSDPDAWIYWHLDDHFIGATQFIHQVELLPETGEHQLILVDGKGEEIVKKFVVVEP
jgi:penicillin-binding protein 1C